MPRLARLDPPGVLPCHGRGIEKRRIFRSDEDIDDINLVL
jgi:hypothetical protein